MSNRIVQQIIVITLTEKNQVIYVLYYTGNNCMSSGTNNKKGHTINWDFLLGTIENYRVLQHIKLKI